MKTLLAAALFILTLVPHSKAIKQHPIYNAPHEQKGSNASAIEAALYLNDALCSTWKTTYTYLNETLHDWIRNGYHRDVAPFVVVILSLITHQIRQHQARLYLTAYLARLEAIESTRIQVNAAAAA